MLVSVTVIVMLFLVLILQRTIIPLISIQGISPDLMLIFIVYWSGQRSRFQGVIAGFTGGLLQDLAGAGVVGVFALSKTIAAYISCSFPWGRLEKNVLPMSVALLAASSVHYMIYYLFQLRNSAAGFLAMLLRYGIPSVVYTTVLGVILYAGTEWIKQKRRRR